MQDDSNTEQIHGKYGIIIRTSPIYPDIYNRWILVIYENRILLFDSSNEALEYAISHFGLISSKVIYIPEIVGSETSGYDIV